MRTAWGRSADRALQSPMAEPSPIVSCLRRVRGLSGDAMAAAPLLAWANGEDWAGGRSHHTLRNTPHDQVAKARATCRRHHDQIDLLGLGHVDNFTVGCSHRHQSRHFYAN